MTGRIANCEECDGEWTLVDSTESYPICPYCGATFDNTYLYKAAAAELVTDLIEKIIFRTNRDMLDFEALKAEVLAQLATG